LRKLALLTALVLSALALGGTNGAIAVKQVSNAKHSCPHLKRGIAFYQAKTWATQDAFNVPRTKASNQKPIGCAYARWVRNAWKWRAKHVKNKLHHAWQLWLPRVWYNLGSCETGYGGEPNWNHRNDDFVSAFGISRAEYDADAAYYNAPPWNDVKPPSPWHQYQAARGHYARWGGFSGWGCA
jgi:hypothetical protein